MSANGRRRVVITGLGAVTPLGNDVRLSWEQLVAGRGAAGPITAFDTTGFAVTFACEAKDFEPTQWIERKQARRMDRCAQMIVAAAHQARADAGLEVEHECDRVGVSVATAMGGLKSFEDACETLIKRGPGRVSPFAIPTIIPNMGAAQISIELGTKGPLTSQCTACAASTMAIGDGLDAIRLGRADVMLAGGGEAPITRVGIAGFSAMRALSQRNDDPEHASRPFGAGRDGFVMGEAGAVLVLEELGHATRRAPSESTSPGVCPSHRPRVRRGTLSALPVRSRRSSARSRSTKGCCRRRSTTRSPIPSAISTTSRTKRVKPTSLLPSQTRPASAGTTHRLCCAGSRDSSKGSKKSSCRSEFAEWALQVSHSREDV